MSMFSDLTDDDIAIMDRQRSLVRDASFRVGSTVWPDDPSKWASLLQDLLDAGAFRPDQTFELQAMGVVLGDILCSEGRFEWAIITDEYGRDPTVRTPSTSLHLNVLTMLSKRVERGERPQVHQLLDWAHARAEKLGDGSP